MSNKICCPKCGSDQLSANKKGFSGKKAVAGAVLTGGVGLLAGTIGSNKILLTCLNCGNQWKPGEKPVYAKKAAPHSVGTYQATKAIMIICLVVFGLLTIVAVVERSWGFLVFCLIADFFSYAGATGIKRPRK